MSRNLEDSALGFLNRMYDGFKSYLMCEEGSFKGYFTCLGPNYSFGVPYVAVYGTIRVVWGTEQGSSKSLESFIRLKSKF